jgi:hypothetical protein
MHKEDQRNEWREIAAHESMSAGDVLWCLLWTVVFVTGLGVFISIFGNIR